MHRRLAALALVSLLGCGGDDDAGTVSDAGSDASVGIDASEGERVGAVSISRTVGGTYQARAAFAAGLSDEPFSCAGSQNESGDCCYVPPLEAPTLHYASAGPVALRSDTLAVGLAGMTPDAASHVYADVEWSTPAWSTGDAIRASAPGEGFPAFDLSTVAPAAVLPSPAWDAGHALVISRADELVLGWVPDASATDATMMTLYLRAEGGATSRGSIACTVADSAGQISVDAALMETFQAGDVCADCGLYRTTRVSAEVDDGRVTLSLTELGGGPATFE